MRQQKEKSPEDIFRETLKEVSGRAGSEAVRAARVDVRKATVLRPKASGSTNKPQKPASGR